MLITVGGVPAHPLLVHAVVVLLPLAALGAVLVAVRPSWIRTYGLIVALLALAGAVSAWLAAFAGNQLAAAIVTPSFQPVIDQHASFGTLTTYIGSAFAVLAIVTWVLDRRSTAVPVGSHRAGAVATAPTSTATRVLAGVTALLGIATVAVTVLAGHSGASAVWGGVAGG